MKKVKSLTVTMAGILLLLGVLESKAVVLVKEGVPQAAIWYAVGDSAANLRAPSDKKAAEDLRAVIKQMSGADMVLKTFEKDGKPEAGITAVVVGELAKQMGMKAPPKTQSGDGYRIQTKGNHLMLAGETPASTFFATSHLLESLGCRWFFDNSVGTVIPSMSTIDVAEPDVSETPDFISRSLWGPNWFGGSWSAHNRLGGIALNSGHNWSKWFCTTDPQIRADYLADVVSRIKDKGAMSTSISPPDGVAYCKCERCAKLDIPDYIEPSSGTVVMSDRYQEFYNYIGSEAAKVNPEAILCHYAYADYTLPPRHVKGGLDNLCVSIAPIRFCRVHSLSSDICESRQRCRQMIEGWSDVEKQMVWREYNYNLAECTVPMSKISVWKDDIPWLKKLGCIGVNIECMYTPHLYGPHTWLVARMAWDADLDIEAAMDDFYSKFGGPAAPHLKAYWERIDEAYSSTPVHSGSYHGVHAFWTPELLKACQNDLAAARNKAGKDEVLLKRIKMFQYGLDNAKHYIAWREAVNRCDFVAAQKSYDALIKNMDAVHAAGYHGIGEYKRGYVPRFLGGGQSAGLSRVTDGRSLVVQLPDEWMFRYDPEDSGEAAGWFNKTVATGDEEWREVRTYSDTLDSQGIPEQLTWMWYQTKFRTPNNLPEGSMTLWFMEPDGNAIKVWVDGEPVTTESMDIRSRQPLDIDLGTRLKPDNEYVLTVKLHHRRISELMLGGILRPVMIYSGGVPETDAK